MIPFTIVVPYRDRAGHLNHFIKHMRARFRDDVEILIVQQEPGKLFNRGKLLNIGFLEADPMSDYVAFHDVDMLPIKADYSYPAYPTHIATKVAQFRHKMPFPEYFGGVTLFNRGDFILCNGYSNNFWSWGGEDNEMYDNVVAHDLKIARRQCSFESLHHLPEDRSQHAENLAKWKAGRQPGDGLDHCLYKIIGGYSNPSFKLIQVSI